MTGTTKKFVSFKMEFEKCTASLHADNFLELSEDAEKLLSKASIVYKTRINAIESILNDIQNTKSKRSPLKARQAWQIGDEVIKLTNNLGKINLQIDDIYEHLERDLGLKKDFLTKIITFRRYMREKNLIPRSLNWRRCRTRPRLIAIALSSNREI